MTKVNNRLIAISLLISLMVSLVVVGVHIAPSESSGKSKILFEYDSGGAIAVEDNIENLPSDAYSDDSNFAMQIMFNYDHYSDALYENQSTEGETFVEYSKKYHTAKNQEFLSEIATDDFDVFVSEYTPYIFINYREERTLDQVYDYAESIADNDFIDTIRIYPDNIYDLDLEAMEVADEEEYVANENEPQATTSSTDSRITSYENFPAGTTYNGSGIKIGLLDTGIFDTSHSNFSDITKEVVYDTYTSNDASATAQHPTWVASVLGGKFGYASAASLYYVDVNSETGYVGIERLINKGCNIVNMSISAASCDNNGEYDTGLEGYLDYIYTSTKIIMVASASNSLNEKGTGGYVALPALCANVISVGSVTSSGVPSDFSSYKIKNDVTSNPNLVAVGSSRTIGGGIGTRSGTSYSAPAVTGALALYFEKNGVKELPAVLAVLSATADDSVIDKTDKTITIFEQDSSGNWVATTEKITCTNKLKKNGSRERTGAGMLDVTALLNYSNSLINYEITFTSTDFVVLKDIYLTAGQTVQIAVAWQRNATLDIDKFLWWETGRTYSSDTLADFDIYLYDKNGSWMNSSTESLSNVEIITFTASTDGYYYLNLKPYSNYEDTHNINYAYVIK